MEGEREKRCVERYRVEGAKQTTRLKVLGTYSGATSSCQGECFSRSARIQV